MSETHYNPKIPFKTSLHLRQFRKFIIKGTPFADARRYDIALHIGSGMLFIIEENGIIWLHLFNINFQREGKSSADTIAFHFDARLNYLGDYKTIVCNHKRERMWGYEERFKIFPFSEQKEFEITIMVYEDM